MTPNSLLSRRKKLGLSQFALAKISKIARNKIHLLENGYTEFSDKEADTLERVFAKEEEKLNVTNAKK